MYHITKLKIFKQNQQKKIDQSEQILFAYLSLEKSWKAILTCILH